MNLKNTPYYKDFLKLAQSAASVGSANPPSTPEDIAVKAAKGSTIVAETFGIPRLLCLESVLLVTKEVHFVSVYIPKATTINGVKFLMNIAGVYTAQSGGFNGVGLYTVNGAAYTKVAESVNDNNIWTSAANTIQSKAFATPYAAQAGLYMVALQYNQQAQTTQPALYGRFLPNAVFSSLDLTNSDSLYGAVTSNAAALPNSIATSSLASKNKTIWVGVY